MQFTKNILYLLLFSTTTLGFIGRFLYASIQPRYYPTNNNIFKLNLYLCENLPASITGIKTIDKQEVNEADIVVKT